MIRNNEKTASKRQGAIVPFFAVLLVPLLGMMAFAVDYGYLVKSRGDLQRAADAAALAAVQDLIPAADGTQDLTISPATVRTYVRDNMNNQGFSIAGADIVIRRFDPATIYNDTALMYNDGIRDAVQVTLRRNSAVNSLTSLFFAQILGVSDPSIAASATAILQKGETLVPGADVLPFAMPQAVWDGRSPGDIWSIYGDGKVLDDDGNTIPGNWGTVDIGPTNNSTAALRYQIENGLDQTDLDALYDDGRIPQDTYIDGSVPLWMQADPGLSSGIKSAVEAVHGLQRIVPIYDSNNGAGGNNLEYHVVSWGVVTVVDSHFQGSKNTYVEVQKSYTYGSNLAPNPDLSVATGGIEGAYTSPVLIKTLTEAP